MEFEIEKAVRWGCPQCANPIGNCRVSIVDKAILICMKCHRKFHRDRLRQMNLIINTPNKATIYYPIESPKEFKPGKLANAGVIFDHIKRSAIDMRDAYYHLVEVEGFDPEYITEKRLRDTMQMIRHNRKFKTNSKIATHLGHIDNMIRVSDVVVKKKKKGD